MSDIGSGETSLADEASLLELLVPLVEHRWLLLGGSLAAGIVALGISFLIPPTYTAGVTFMPPQQPQSAAASALASLGPLASLATGGAGALRTPADQYQALMESATVSSRIIDRFELMRVYDKKLRADAFEMLKENVRISIGKRDGLIRVEVDDHSPQRAAEMANRYVEELRETTSRIAVTEAQQRRQFFEVQLQQTRDRLADAQTALQASGFSQGALKAEPKAAAEGYARARAEVTAAELRLLTLRGSLADDTPEVWAQQKTLAALRSNLARLEQVSEAGSGPDYVGKYREFKYQETLFDLYARQFELARVDESRESGLIQVVDVAMPPEKRSKPRRGYIAVATTLAAGFVLALFILARNAWRRAALDPSNERHISRLRSALGRSKQA